MAEGGAGGGGQWLRVVQVEEDMAQKEEWKELDRIEDHANERGQRENDVLTPHTAPYATPYTLHRTYCTVHTAPYILHRTHCTVHTAPYTLHRTYKLNRTYCTVHAHPTVHVQRKPVWND